VDLDKARACLNSPTKKKPSEIGEAVNLLFLEFRSYKKIAEQVELSPERISVFHRVYKLPKGIQWQVDNGKILIGHAMQISRLNENNQWLLAFVIVEEKISVKDSRTVVNAVINSEQELSNVLKSITGIDSNNIKAQLLPLSFSERFQISRSAWGKEMSWVDFNLKSIMEATRVDIEQIADELTKIVKKINPDNQ
jgi:hypothetical protein